ncbi:hypothetical protein OQY15_10210 [Pedobacter sp. MC2016-15]|uniref:hypothetical protein n=1 Tax=Pedobacter sp. MC2016-15 TaxID=2994473 RepID=UPI0022454CDD|nr:hypothetical protein [Pedobacter sp. MC2016-15]MCX2479463.1 hypothetical protein [Pedobacter sp. MC2016-15]
MQEKDIYNELSSIRNLMERSTKFISLSGLSGVLAGIYALIGAFIGYKLVDSDFGELDYKDQYVTEPRVLLELFLIAVTVLLLSLLTCIFLTIRQARKRGENFWNPVSQRLVVNMSIPLFTGGLFMLILLFQGSYGIIAPASLIFYGLSLIAGSQFTFSDVKWLGYCQIIIGLAAMLFPAYSILFWMMGFGLLHIIYGSVMHFKYKQ